MHRTARQATIMKILDRHGTCTVAGMARRFRVADETVRRDFKSMAAKGLIERVHGGAVLPDLFREPDFQRRLDRNAEAKRAIARAAAARVRHGESLMMDTGSTTTYVARALSGHTDLMIVTNCTEIARTLAARGRNKVYLAGGEFRADDGAIFGAAATRFVERFRVRTAILSIAAIHPEAGFMNFHLGEAVFSQAVMRRAGRVIVVADHSKLDAQAPVRVCDFANVDLLVTDRDLPPPLAARFARDGVEVVVAA